MTNCVLAKVIKESFSANVIFINKKYVMTLDDKHTRPYVFFNKQDGNRPW